ncbi:MAG TPA: hypothetical protein VEO36_07610 [Casimicrobiaceae bacterium]|nr:hypothetical protein [Casimicrobiaceae bacterium]
MNTMTKWSWCKGAIIAVALMAAPVAVAGPSAASPEMKTALTKAAEGPDQLRRYVERTRTIYALRYNDVMDSFEASKVAATDSTPQVAQSATK